MHGPGGERAGGLKPHTPEERSCGEGAGRPTAFGGVRYRADYDVIDTILTI